MNFNRLINNLFYKNDLDNYNYPIIASIRELKIFISYFFIISFIIYKDRKMDSNFEINNYFYFNKHEVS